MEKQKKKRDNSKRVRNVQLALRITNQEAELIKKLQEKTQQTKTNSILIAIKEYLGN